MLFILFDYIRYYVTFDSSLITVKRLINFSLKKYKILLFFLGVGLVFSPLHAIIPFLMMGIGVDDMFVIIQCLYNLEEKCKFK